MSRDDLFTHIHKALRKGLFDLAVQLGATDWSDPLEVAEVELACRPLVALLRSHTRHEDEHIFRILDPYDRAITTPLCEQHSDLEDLLDDVVATLETTFDTPSAANGLRAYRDLCRFIALYLPHLHEEETVIMERIWVLCSDDEIAATRAAFFADITPQEAEYTIGLMLPALDATTRAELIGAHADR